MIYPKHTPEIIKPLGKHLTFDIPNDSNEIYLTFDDGPHPSITPLVLDQLKVYDAKATFFLIGKNAEQHPEIIAQITDEGHSIGNHTYQHISGWKSKNSEYFKDIETCASHVNSKLFRPPYGRITRSQSTHLRNQYRIVMWSDLSADFEEGLSIEHCVHCATNRVKSGSIIVFHDSEKAWPRLEKALPKCLKYYRDQGFSLAPIEMH